MLTDDDLVMHAMLHRAKQALPSDYADYGGEIQRWAQADAAYPDCSGGCRHWRPLKGTLGWDWGVCVNLKGPRFGLLTFEHQAGFECFDDAVPYEWVAAEDREKHR